MILVRKSNNFGEEWILGERVWKEPIHETVKVCYSNSSDHLCMVWNVYMYICIYVTFHIFDYICFIVVDQRRGKFLAILPRDTRPSREVYLAVVKDFWSYPRECKTCARVKSRYIGIVRAPPSIGNPY